MMGRKKLLVVDGSSMLSTGYYAFLPNEIRFAKTEEERKKHYDKLLHAPDGTYTNGVYGMVTQLVRLLEGWKPDFVVLAFDKTRNTFRRAIYGDYKAQRSETPFPLKEQFLLAEELFAECGFPVFVSDTFEADDLAGSITEKYKEDLQIRLVSKDKDYTQLVDDEHDVRLWTQATSKTLEQFSDLFAIYTGDEYEAPAYLKNYLEYTEEMVFADMGVYPKLIPDLKGIQGDTSDNIPGVAGVSSAAAPLLNEYGSIEAIYEAIEDCNDDKKAEKELTEFWKKSLGIARSPLSKLKEGKDMGLLSKNLATIRRDCEEAKEYDLYLHPVESIDTEKFNQRLLELGIKSVKLSF